MSEQFLGEVDQNTQPSVGAVLRESRAYYGYSVAQVADLLKIREKYISALEQDQPEELPGPVYALGFVRSYAEFLRLDADQLIGLYKKQQRGQLPRLTQSISVPLVESQVPGIATVFVSLLVMIVLSFIFAGEDQAIESEITEAPAEWVAHGKRVIAGEDAALEGVTTPSDPLSHQQPSIEIIALEESWLQIENTQTEEVIFTGLLQVGMRFDVPVSESRHLVLQTGNAGGFEIIVDGRSLPRSGEQGEVQNNISLDYEVLKTLQDMAISGRNNE